MVFPTLQFILFFLAVLTLTLLIGVSDRWAGLRKVFLLAASYLFYAAWDVRFTGLMALVSLIAWSAGFWVRDLRFGRLTLILSIVALLSILGVFKYFNFFLLSLQHMLGDSALARDLSWMRVVLPVGISFYIFQAISYVVDVSRKDVAVRHNPLDVFLYISFFPQLVAGPIVRASDFLPQLDRPARVDAAMRGAAVFLILTGLFKKMVVANYLAVLLVDPVYAFPEGQSWSQALTAVVGYSVQIFCDFSGYSDIAIGTALLLGYRFRRNFDQPYRACGLSDFWRRWHISLSSWIRDYLYIPLGGNRGSPFQTARTLMITMTLAGLWHGAGWTFLVWGILHGAGLVAERALSRLQALRQFAVLSLPLTFAFVTFLWVPFRSDSWARVGDIATALTRTTATAPVALEPTVFALIATGLAMNWLPPGWSAQATTTLGRAPATLQALLLAAGIVFCFAMSQDGVAPFIYFQF
jgi:D-alanyl-lipoteichoic acid acyltransferase DltB (MBOAT superfamily)